MKTKLFVALAIVSMLLFQGRAYAADAPAAKTASGLKAELNAIIGKIQAKAKEGKKTEQDVADELKEFDALLARHKDEKTDDVANILYMKAMVYLQFLQNTEKGTSLIQQLKRDYPETKQAQSADKILESIKKQAEAKKIKDALVEGAKFPDFNEKDVTGKPLSIANYKGKVVLIDFWATWCGPCVRELPNVLETYEKHHGQGFEIIGISLDEKQEKLTKFTEEKKMPWQQFFDGQGWGNKLAGKYGVQSIPATYLLDKQGKILAKDLRGEDLEAAVAKAVAAK